MFILTVDSFTFGDSLQWTLEELQVLALLYRQSFQPRMLLLGHQTYFVFGSRQVKDRLIMLVKFRAAKKVPESLIQ